MFRVFCCRWQGRGGDLEKARCRVPCGVVVVAAEAAVMTVTAEEGVVLYRIRVLRSAMVTCDVSTRLTFGM